MRQLNPKHQKLAQVLSDTDALTGNATRLAMKYNPVVSKGKVHYGQDRMLLPASIQSVSVSTGRGVGSSSISDLNSRLHAAGLIKASPITSEAALAALMPKVQTGELTGKGVAAAINSSAAGELAKCLYKLKMATKSDEKNLQLAEKQLVAQLKSLKLQAKNRQLIIKEIEILNKLGSREAAAMARKKLQELDLVIAGLKGELITKVAYLVSRLQDPSLMDCLLKIAESEGALEAHAEYDATTVDEAITEEGGAEKIVEETEAGSIIDEAAPTIPVDYQMVPTGEQPRKDLIKGIPNMYLGIGGLALLAILALRR